MANVKVLVAKPGLDGHDRGAHNTLFPKVVELLKEKGLNAVLVIGGGVIPDADIPGLKAAGIAEVFTPGTPTSKIVDFINANVK